MSRTPGGVPPTEKSRVVGDLETPMTDALAKRFAKDTGYGLGKVSPEDVQKILWEHAREMERRWYISRQLAVTYLRAMGGELP